METPGTDVRAVHQGAFVITTMPCQTRFDRQLIAIIGPPAIDPEPEVFAMARPIIVDVERGTKIFGCELRIELDGCAKEISWSMIDVKDDLEIEIVQGIDLLDWLIKYARIEIERAVAHAPTVGAIAGAEVNQCVAREFLFPERPGNAEGLLGTCKSAVRLKVAECPFWR